MSCFGPQFKNEPCPVADLNKPQLITSGWYGYRPFGDINYGFDRRLIGSDIREGLINIEIANSLIAALTIMWTAAVTSGRIRKIYLVVLLSSFLIPDNLIHTASIAPIGICKISILSAAVSTLSFMDKKNGTLNELSKILLLIFSVVMVAIRRPDQLVILSGIALTFLGSALTYEIISRNKNQQFHIRVKRFTASLFFVITSLFTAYLISKDNNIDKSIIMSAANFSGVGDKSSGVLSKSIDISKIGPANLITTYVKEGVLQPAYFVLDLIPIYWHLPTTIYIIMTLLVFLALFGLLVVGIPSLIRQRFNLIAVCGLLLLLTSLIIYSVLNGPRLELRYVSGLFTVILFLILFSINETTLEKLTNYSYLIGILVFATNFGGIAFYLRNTTGITLGYFDLGIISTLFLLLVSISIAITSLLVQLNTKTTAEQGTHDQLMNANSLYASQVRAGEGFDSANV